MGRGLRMKEHSSFIGADIESSFHEQSSTTPSAKLMGFETSKEEYLNRETMARRKLRNTFRIDMDNGLYFTLTADACSVF